MTDSPATDGRWAHTCPLPWDRSYAPSGWSPAVPPGQVWYCGCGRAYGHQVIDGVGRWIDLSTDLVDIRFDPPKLDRSPART